MFTKNEGQKAISSLNGSELKGKQLKVNQAYSRNDNRGPGGGGNRRDRGRGGQRSGGYNSRY